MIDETDRGRRMLKYDDIEDLLARIENGDIFKDEEDMDDLNEIDYHSGLQDRINELEDNDDAENNENPPLTMEEGLLYHFNNPTPGPSNCQPHSSLLGVPTWRQRSREIIWKKQ
ncbi:hypothetical protein TNCV_434101 [Trichonephila clavipes]|nr:hypothetical protein TNCV_434101 [Trichonephila clavipes]